MKAPEKFITHAVGQPTLNPDYVDYIECLNNSLLSANKLLSKVNGGDNCFANKGDSEENMQADLQRELDADRWNALLNSPFRLFGYAGLDHKEPNRPCQKLGKDGYAHFGCEMWTRHSGWKAGDGKDILIGFADQAIKYNAGNKTS